MRILFDHCTPAPLRRHLTGHIVDTADERGWSRLRNGNLLDAAEAEGYNLLITTDQDIRYQQNFSQPTDCSADNSGQFLAAHSATYWRCTGSRITDLSGPTCHSFHINQTLIHLIPGAAGV